MWQRIEKEKRVAEHLLYVSLKYTKTCDVIINLIARWQSMIDECIEALLLKAKNKRMISTLPTAPKVKVDTLLKIFKKEKDVVDVLQMYTFFKKIPYCEQLREGEFRKNVALKVIDKGRIVSIDLEKLKEWYETLERFLSFVRHFIT